MVKLLYGCAAIQSSITIKPFNHLTIEVKNEVSN
jgi:hypothetical protein